MNEFRVTIRKMTEDDAVFVAGIENKVFSQPWPEAEFAKASKADNYIYLVAEHEGRIIGYAGCVIAADDADITNIAVDCNFRNYGIGAQLLKQLIIQAGNRSVVNIFLEVRKSNAAAIGLYTGIGFERVGLRRNFYQKPTEDAILMAKKLQ